MTATSLPDFLLARIAEDETAAASAAGISGVAAVMSGSRPNSRWLAECAAKRRIVELHHVRDDSPSCAECGGYTTRLDDTRGITHHGFVIPWPCPTLRALAAVYADHPDHRDEWRP